MIPGARHVAEAICNNAGSIQTCGLTSTTGEVAAYSVLVIRRKAEGTRVDRELEAASEVASGVYVPDGNNDIVERIAFL